MVRAPLQHFAEQMEEKLKQNDRHKTHWSGSSNRQLIRGLDRNYFLLNEKVQTDGDLDFIISKATNVANFALMIASNAERKKRRNAKRKKK